MASAWIASAGVGPALLVGLAVIALVIGVGTLVVSLIAARQRAGPLAAGPAGSLIGSTGVVLEAQGWTGQALVQGARWQVTSTTTLRPGMRVRVVALDGLTASVQPDT